MRLFKAFLITVLASGFFVSNAQTALHIFKSDTTPGTVALGTSFSFNALIRNDSASVFSNVIGFGYTINGDTSQVVSDSTSGVQFSSFSSLLNPGDSTARSITVHVSGPKFQAGPSVVVIWPIAVGAHALDSLVLNIFVEQPNALPTIDENLIKIFIAEGSLQIKSTKQIDLKHVRIFDVTGKEILNQTNPFDNVSLPIMGTGHYVAEITYNQNQRKIFRFCR